MPELSMVQALNAALRHCLREDPRTMVFGEDVGALGGVFRVTDGLQREFGSSRVFDTPLAESGIVGISVGLAMAGWRPVPEIQFDGFSFPALDQVLTNLAKYRGRSRGAYSMPVTLRLPSFGGIGGPEHHSESPETLYAHTAGLKVVAPSGAQEAFDLLVLAISDPDPVVFLEPKSRYWAREEVSLYRASVLPVGRARVVRSGSHATLVAWGAMVARCLEVAAAAEEDGVSLEVLDLRWLAPLDEDALVESVSRTGRAVVVHEAPRTAGFGAEVAARLMERCFGSLRAPVLRVTGWDVPYPAASVEQAYIPSVDRVLMAVQRVLDA
ncbi:MAG TPA: alpha-ketoacid dehydrogenase subunit beta [Candidatus Dormibacteraeota bacterium]|nr:alpha-ketoacid dehydrogenase subunit beta [Candidatus Dormibacteraeota bacterium]